MGVRPYTESRAEANKRYDDKTYKKMNIKLRLDDDADIIASIDEAHKNGISIRQWIRDMFDQVHQG